MYLSFDRERHQWTPKYIIQVSMCLCVAFIRRSLNFSERVFPLFSYFLWWHCIDSNFFQVFFKLTFLCCWSCAMCVIWLPIWAPICGICPSGWPPIWPGIGMRIWLGIWPDIWLGQGTLGIGPGCICPGITPIGGPTCIINICTLKDQKNLNSQLMTEQTTLRCQKSDDANLQCDPLDIEQPTYLSDLLHEQK